MLYADLVRAPIATIRAVYDQLGIELTDEAAARMQAYIEARPKGRHGGRHYRFSHLGVEEADMRERFAAYMQHYGVPEEEL